MKKTSSYNYINNKDFYDRLKEWHNSNEFETKIPEDIGYGIMQICTNLAKSGKFSGYSWKDQMVGDAIVACVRFIRNFDPEKSNNPFAYFTQIAFNVFRKTIKSEKKILVGMMDYRDSLEMMYDIPEQEKDDSDDSSYNYIDNTAKSINRVYIKEKPKKKKSSSKSNIEEFLND